MRLGDVCTIYTGTGFPVRYQGNSQGNYPFYKVGDIAKNVTAGNVYLELCDNYVEKDVVKKIKGSILPARTVVFAKIGEAVKVNRRAITSCECLIDNNVMGIAPNEAVLALDYFYHYMCQLRLETFAEATTVPSVKKSIVENLDIPVPSIAEQQMISKTLNKVSKLIAMRKEQLAKLDQLVKSRFVELFGTCDTYELLEDSNIHISDGNYSSKYPTADEFVEEGVPFIRASNMEMNTIVDSNMYFITKEKHAILLKGHVKAGDVLITTRGATIGKIACVPPRHEDSNINAQIVLLRCPNNEYNPLFLSWYLKLDNTQAEIQKLISGSAQPQLPIKRLVQLRILKPNIGLQNQFATFVEQTDKSKLAIQQSLDKLELLKKSLMQEYFG